MKVKKALLGASALALLALAMPLAGASAQWSATAIGVAEYDTDETLLILGGISAGPSGMGWSPRIGVQAYHLGFGQNARTSVVVVKPYVGVRNSFSGGSASINVGYAFSNKDFEAPVIASETGDGVVLSGGWDHWGTGGPFGYQFLGSYNFGTESIWLRARGSQRMSQRPSGGQTRLGAEVAYLSDNSGFSAIQPGVVFEMHSGSGSILGLGAGMKFFEGGGDAVYFKVEGVLPILR